MKNKPVKQKEKRTKVVTIRMAPSIHELLTLKAKGLNISLSKFMIQTALKSKPRK